MSPLLAQSRHSRRRERCPLLGVKRIWRGPNAMSAFDPNRRFAQHAFDYFRTANLRSYDGLPGGQATGFYARHQKIGGELCNALLVLVLQYSFPPVWLPRHKPPHPVRRDLRKRPTITVS